MNLTELCHFVKFLKLNGNIDGIEINLKEEEKMITKILNNYFNELFKKNLKREIVLRFNLDIKFEEEKNGICYLYLKPKKYQNYTLFLDWHKGDSLNHLINLQKIEINYIIKRLKNMADNDWN